MNSDMAVFAGVKTRNCVPQGWWWFIAEGVVHLAIYGGFNARYTEGAHQNATHEILSQRASRRRPLLAQFLSSTYGNMPPTERTSQ